MITSHGILRRYAQTDICVDKEVMKISRPKKANLLKKYLVIMYAIENAI